MGSEVAGFRDPISGEGVEAGGDDTSCKVFAFVLLKEKLPPTTILEAGGLVTGVAPDGIVIAKGVELFGGDDSNTVLRFAIF
jgi:hypothetical protein